MANLTLFGDDFAAQLRAEAACISLPPVYEFKLKVRRILNLNLCFRKRRRKSKLNIPPLQ